MIGKALTAHIAPDGVRVIEGDYRDGQLNVEHFFTVAGVSGYFAPPVNSSGSYLIKNMHDLVTAITTECANRCIGCKKIFVVSDCLQITTTLETESSRSSIKEFLLTDSADKKSKEDKAKKVRAPKDPDKISTKVSWGSLVEDGKLVSKATITTGDRYTLKSLVNEFYSAGYSVIGVSDVVGALMNLRNAEESTFDAQGKICVYCGETIKTATFYRDVPILIEQQQVVDKFLYTDTLLQLLQRTHPKAGINPHVFIGGPYLADFKKYSEVLNEIFNHSISVSDVFNSAALDEEYFRKVGEGSIEPNMTPDYLIALATTLAVNNKSCIKLLPSVDLDVRMRKSSSALASIAVTASIVLLIGACAGAAIRAVKQFEMESNPSMVAAFQSELNSLKQKQSSFNSTISTLTRADTTVLKLVEFIQSHQSESVSVISLDTQDMLSSDLGVTGNVAAPIATPSTETPADPSKEDATNTSTDASAQNNQPPKILSGSVGVEQQAALTTTPIILRGYARSGTAAVSYFDTLFRYGLSVDPVLNGVEKYTLPDGNDVYIFEIQIGGVV